MRILVAGDAGFIGSHIIDKLIELKHHVCIVANLLNNEVINISSNKAATVNEVFVVMRDIAGRDVEAIYNDVRKGDIEHSYLDNSTAVKKLGWKVRFKLEDGARETVQYYKRVYGVEKEVATQVET